MDNKDNFVGGMRVSRHEKAPDFVIANFGVNIGDFLEWANKHSKRGWVNFQVKRSKGGKLYAELDTYERKTPPEQGGNDEGYRGQAGHVEDVQSCKDCTDGTCERCDAKQIPF